MERSVTLPHSNSTDYDDLSPEEVTDIKEYYSDKTERKKFSTVEELLQDLKN